MNRKINNLEELLQEKARIQAQIKIVQTELNASAQRTRVELKALVEDKFSLTKQLGQLFQSDSLKQGAATSALQAAGRIAGGSSWWGGIAASLLPMVIDFVRRQIERRRERKAAAPAIESTASDTPATSEGAPPKPRSRNPFRRKKRNADGAE